MQQHIELMEIGAIAIFAAYNLVLYSQIRRNHYLFLGLLSFFIFLRATLVDDGSMTFFAFFPDLSLTLGRKIEYFSSYISAPLSLLFSYSLYPFVRIRKYVNILLGISAAFLIIVMVTPYSFFYYTLDAYHVVIFISFIFMFMVLIRALRKESTGAMNVLTGATLCFLFVLAELLKNSGLIYLDVGPNLINTGFLVFLFFQSIALSEIFAESFRDNQLLNEDLEKRVNIKTAELARASLLRDTLIRIVSHDIRGPMSNLKSVISLVREEQIGLEQAKEFMGTIDNSVDHTIRMLDELMEWGHAASANKRIEQEEIILGDIVNPTIDHIQSHIERKELSMDLVGDMDVKCLFDKNALKVVIRNLISNAVKFTPKGGSIKFDIEKRSEDILVSVTDTGIGIPDEMKTNLFEMKKDNKRPGTDNEKSSGVGLFICKDLINQNGGSIEVEDNPEGKGTTFKFTLKLA